MQGYGCISKPLTNLLRKDQFGWSEEAQMAFEALKSAMISPPVLALSDFNETFILETNASYRGIGAVLMQKGHPLAFISKSCSLKHQAMSVYEKELFAIVYAVGKWHHYLVGRHFIIRTDHHSLKYLLQQRVSIPGQRSWLTKLKGYDYEICFKKGKENCAADALSRITGDEIAVSSISSELIDEIKDRWSKDQKLVDLIAQLQANKLENSVY